MTRKFGAARDWVANFLDLRDGHKCFMCGRSDVYLIIEHMDNDENNYAPANLHWACWSCNQKKGKTSDRLLPQSVSENTRREWTSEEGARHDSMTYRYRNLLFHPHNGMMVNEGARVGLVKLSKKLPDLVGKGSSVTFRRYIEEDIEAGYFEVKTEDGVDIIERTDKAYPLERLGVGP
jgi:hypothetical protein